MCSCPAGQNGNACPHQAAVVLKFGVSNCNFIPRNHVDKYNLAVLAIGDHPDLLLDKFADIHQKTLDLTLSSTTSMALLTNSDDQQLANIPLQNASNGSENHDDDIHVHTTNSNDIPIEDVLKLHKEVSDDVEFWLRSGDQNFIKCYSKYLDTYRKIINKARGQTPLNNLSSAYVSFGKNTSGKLIPILHNSNKRIHVQPTSISRRKSGIKSSQAQPPGRKPTPNKRDQDSSIMTVRKKKKQANRKRNLAMNINLNQPNAGHTR